MSTRRIYELTDEDVRIIRRALNDRRDDIQADPDYADDERAEHLEGIANAREALDVADFIREQASKHERLLRESGGLRPGEFGHTGPHDEERRSGPGRRRSDLPGTPSERAREVEAGEAGVS